MSKYLSKVGLKSYVQARITSGGGNEELYMLQDEIARGAFDASPLEEALSGYKESVTRNLQLNTLLAERDAEIQRLRSAMKQIREDLGWGEAVSAAEAAQKAIDAALSHQTEQPDTQHKGFEFPRQPDRRGDWVIAPEYLERVTKDIENNHLDVLGGYTPALEDIELVLLAVERMSQPDTPPGPSKSSMGLMLRDNDQHVELRPPVRWFAEQMELTLRANDHKGGWDRCSLQYLFEKLDEEVGELSATLSDEETIREAADAANICMMIADLARQPAPKGEDSNGG